MLSKKSRPKIYSRMQIARTAEQEVYSPETYSRSDVAADRYLFSGLWRGLLRNQALRVWALWAATIQLLPSDTAPDCKRGESAPLCLGDEGPVEEDAGAGAF